MKRAFLAAVCVIIAAAAIFLSSSRHREKATPKSESNGALTNATNESTAIKPEIKKINKESLDAETRQKVETLESVLTSRNDNDPRLDKELRELNASQKKAFKETYEGLKLEMRNERGTIVFLLGRNIKDREDLDFFGSVLNEKPCLSLADCSRDVAQARDDEEHSMAGMDVSMNYPQLVALNSLQQTLERNIPGIDKKDVFDILDRASKSEVDIISGKAKEILTRYYRK